MDEKKYFNFLLEDDENLTQLYQCYIHFKCKNSHLLIQKEVGSLSNSYLSCVFNIFDEHKCFNSLEIVKFSEFMLVFEKVIKFF